MYEIVSEPSSPYSLSDSTKLKYLEMSPATRVKSPTFIVTDSPSETVNPAANGLLAMPTTDAVAIGAVVSIRN